ncbi:MAG: hypothetical protein CL745_04775 [Chloroflexi bacterium]|nr:hypothetical protein [Chloroflexota bacterium]|tara:strand:+ start:60 stop:701 length:642 start_codon:yes stop_codon:yes gene_type:complete
MISKKFASIMMIFGPILTLIMAFTGPLNPTSGVAFSDTQAVLGKLATSNTDWAQINFLLLSIGLIMQVLGIRYFVNSMNSNNSVVNYSLTGGMAMIMGVIVVFGEGLFYGAAANAAAIAGGAGMGAAASMWAGGQAFGAGGSILLFLGLALVSISAYVTNTFNKIIAILLAVVSIVGVILCLIGEYTNDLMIIPYLGTTIGIVALGILTLRSK